MNEKTYEINANIVAGDVVGEPIVTGDDIVPELLDRLIDIGLAVERFEVPSEENFTGEINIYCCLINVEPSKAPNSTPMYSWTIEQHEGNILAENNNLVYTFEFLYVSTK